MLFKHIFLVLIVLLLIFSYVSEGQNEIRNAVKAKTNRKIKEGKKVVQRGKQTIRRAKTPFKKAGAKIRGKYQNTRRKIQAIEEIIQS